MRIPPMPPRDERPAGEQGFVSLRDQFAAAALTGLLAGFQNGKSCDSYAAEAYEVADAMLRARQPTE
jgi:hypothetical protein